MSLPKTGIIDSPEQVKFLEDVVEIAEIELKERKTPFIIKRDLPSGKNEFWKLSDMIY